MTYEQKDKIGVALCRAQELLEVVTRFMDKNHLAASYTVHYDEADCDGECLGNDCEVAASEIACALRALAECDAETVQPSEARP